MGGKNGKPQIQIERPTPTPKSAKSFKAKSRTDTDGSLEAQVHAPAIDEVFAMPATQQVAADYAEPVSACSFDGALRHQDDGPEKTAQAASGLPRVQILLLCYCRMIEPIMVSHTYDAPFRIVLITHVVLLHLSLCQQDDLGDWRHCRRACGFLRWIDRM